MRKNLKIVNIELWKDFYDEHWRVKVIFWKWEVARFKIFTSIELPYTIEIERVKDGNH